MAGVAGTLYDGENFQLLFKFNNKYPFDSPEVSSFTENFFLFLLFRVERFYNKKKFEKFAGNIRRS